MDLFVAVEFRSSRQGLLEVGLIVSRGHEISAGSSRGMSARSFVRENVWRWSLHDLSNRTFMYLKVLHSKDLAIRMAAKASILRRKHSNSQNKIRE
jgi:hypothetical protein